MNALLRILRQIFGEIFPDPMSETLAADIAAVVFMLPAVPDAPRIRLFGSGVFPTMETDPIPI